MLVRNVGLKGKQKLADRWERQPYIVRRQPNPGIPVYEVQLENSRSKKISTLHRNLLLPSMSIPCDGQQPPADKTLLEAAPTEDTETMSEQGNQDHSNDISDHFSYNVDSLSKDQDSDSDRQATERYVTPMRRKPGAPGLLPRSNLEQTKEDSQSRPSRPRSKSRNENPQKLTQLSSRSLPKHLVGKRTAQKDTIIDITSDSQLNGNFPHRWSPACLTFNNYFDLLLYLYIT